MYACVRLGDAIGHISFNLRVMASTEFGEVEEGRRPGQKGSTAMPQEHNPIKDEQLDGLARTLRGYLGSSLEKVELLFDRDISHSGPERIVLDDALILTHYVSPATMDRLLQRLVVKPERMQENIDRSMGLMFTQTVLTEMIDMGWGRDDAYRVIQALAEQALDEKRPLRKLLETEKLGFDPEQLDRIFDQDRLLENIGGIIEQLPVGP